MIYLWGSVIAGIFWWGHYALERNVNRMADQLQDQLHAATARIASLEGEVEDLKREHRGY